MVNTETTEQDYISRVGSIFAIAVYRGAINDLYIKKEEVRAAKERMASSLGQHFEENAEDDETFFDVAFDYYLSAIDEQIKKYKRSEAIALQMDCEGTNPGKLKGL